MRVIVVGAGVVGASVAYHLAVLGADVVVVDAAREGQATAAGAGVVFPWPLPGSPPAMAALGLAAAEHHPRLVQQLAAEVGETGYARVGAMTVLPEGPGLAAMHDGLLKVREQPGMSGLGDVERLPVGEPAQRFPALRPDLAGLFVSGVGRVDGRVMRDALLAAAAARGAQRRSGQAALSLDGRDVTGVIVDSEVLGADAVVVAAGAWSASLCAPLRVALPLFPQRGQILHVDLVGQDTVNWPIVRTLEDHYLLAFPGGRVVAGATRESDAGFDHRVTAGGVHQVLTSALAVAPGLEAGTVAEVRVGFRPATPDGLPLLGGVDGVARLVVATGLGAVGLTLGPLLGSLAADLALGRDVSLDVSAYRPDRPAPA